jgi:hypothetical protein
MTETRLLTCWPIHNFRFLRESITLPEHAAKVAYTIDDKGKVVRFFWVWPPTYDGFDPPHDQTPHKLIEPRSIQLNAESQPWRPLTVPSLLHPRLSKLPPNLLRRWEMWNAEYRRVLPTRFQQFTGGCHVVVSNVWRRLQFWRWRWPAWAYGTNRSNGTDRAGGR